MEMWGCGGYGGEMIVKVEGKQWVVAGVAGWESGEWNGSR